jgi:hypothetical protein
MWMANRADAAWQEREIIAEFAQVSDFPFLLVVKGPVSLKKYDAPSRTGSVSTKHLILLHSIDWHSCGPLTTVAAVETARDVIERSRYPVTPGPALSSVLIKVYLL